MITKRVMVLTIHCQCNAMCSAISTNPAFEASECNPRHTKPLLAMLIPNAWHQAAIGYALTWLCEIGTADEIAAALL